ncbi:hypothetical protein P691DRAFT_713671 [Macrolepiota fuliginosa MF-IS2]|uniref:DUF6593 domain-containing protein n=1 Tax=Macrolepiota fuliginosa MF-IS2 TaxID=1400762 RepID=A0A9P5X4B0_9AGAR|nr:hypothetical protein P691DRAFT_713671 [Macrolepiota fuliginosa MF-IS2]
MESKLTLVNPDNVTIRLVFSKNSTLNANLLINGQTRYTISTTDPHAQKTKIIDAITKEEVARIRKRTFLSDKISFARRQGGAEQKVHDVLQDHKMDDGHTAHMIHTEQGDFYWKMHPVYRLALFSISDPAHPLAYRESVSDPIITFALVIRRECEEITDYIIPTFLLLEQQMRMGEKQSDIADGMICENRTLMGHYVDTRPS